MAAPPRRPLRRSRPPPSLAAAIAIVFIAGVVSAVVGGDDGGPLDRSGAARCGAAMADLAGMEPLATSASPDGTTWRVSVAVDRGVLGMIVRSDGQILEVVMAASSGGTERLDRATRLQIFERGC